MSTATASTRRALFDQLPHSRQLNLVENPPSGSAVLQFAIEESRAREVSAMEIDVDESDEDTMRVLPPARVQ